MTLRRQSLPVSAPVSATFHSYNTTYNAGGMHSMHAGVEQQYQQQQYLSLPAQLDNIAIHGRTKFQRFAQFAFWSIRDMANSRKYLDFIFSIC